nr:retrovirus-related Pol polyprotein from transposon TNT 1-94 [Tanacetum cinerariifolium]
MVSEPATSSNEAWTILKTEFQRSYKRSRGRERGSYRGRGRGRNSSLRCSNCNKYGHSEKFCWSKPEKAKYVEEEEDENYLFMTHGEPKESTKDIWYIDSGCSNHMTGDRSKFEKLDESRKSQVRLGDDKQIKVEGRGTAMVTAHNEKKLIRDVNFAPCLAHNLLSVGQLMESGHSVLFDDGECVVTNKATGKAVAHARMSANRMFPLVFSSHTESVMISKIMEETELWHLRYGHLYIKGLQLLKNKQMVNDIPDIKSLTHVCEGCVLGKQAKNSFPVGKSKRATNVLELIHADLCGPMKSESLAGSKYFLLFIDDYSRMSWVYFLKLKSESFECFKKFKAMVEKQSGKVVKVLRTDRGGEFLSKEFTNFCDEEGIKRELTAPHTPEQNGVAERKNRTVVEMARSMM